MKRYENKTDFTAINLYMSPEAIALIFQQSVNKISKIEASSLVSC